MKVIQEGCPLVLLLCYAGLLAAALKMLLLHIRLQALLRPWEGFLKELENKKAGESQNPTTVKSRNPSLSLSNTFKYQRKSSLH